MKLGKKPAVRDERDLLFHMYVDRKALPKPPARFGFGTMFKDWGMLGNDEYGDCVWAGAAHETMLWTKVGSHAAAHFNDRAVLADYSRATGFDPADPDTDQGTSMRASLNYRRRTGVTDAHLVNHRVAAYVALRPGDWDELLQATYLFGAAAVGLEFPDTAMEQFDHGQIWDVTEPATIEGGHYVPCVGTMARTKRATVVTWGKRQEMTRAFYQVFCDEAYALLSQEVLAFTGVFHGFNLAQLRADLARL